MTDIWTPRRFGDFSDDERSGTDCGTQEMTKKSEKLVTQSHPPKTLFSIVAAPFCGSAHFKNMMGEHLTHEIIAWEERGKPFFCFLQTTKRGLST